MLNEYSIAYERLQEQKRNLLRHMDSLSDDERRWRATPRQLSPLQVLAHVVKVEETVVGSETAPIPGHRVQLKGRIFMLTMVNLMRPGFRIPTLSVLHPKTPDSYEEIKRNWDRARQYLANRIESLSEATKNRPIANHMMAGPLNASMALDFLMVHLNYHHKNFPQKSFTQRKDFTSHELNNNS